MADQAAALLDALHLRALVDWCRSCGRIFHAFERDPNVAAHLCPTCWMDRSCE